jgi:hypothetical protein
LFGLFIIQLSAGQDHALDGCFPTLLILFAGFDHIQAVAGRTAGFRQDFASVHIYRWCRGRGWRGRAASSLDQDAQNEQKQNYYTYLLHLFSLMFDGNFEYELLGIQWPKF